MCIRDRLYTLSYLYSGEGYYIHVDDDFYDELSDQLFSRDNDSVRRVLHLFVEYGFFDSSLYERYGILTSADIQRQFLFITKRRSRRHISPDYCLLPDEETVHSTLPDAVAETPDIVTQTLDTVTESPGTATKSTLITVSYTHLDVYKRQTLPVVHLILSGTVCQGCGNGNFFSFLFLLRNFSGWRLL